MTTLPRVTVVGGAGVGLVFSVEQLPAAGESVLAGGLNTMSGGKSANQAIGVGFLGADCRIISAVGDDIFKPTALGALQKHGVDVGGVIVSKDNATMVGVVIVDDDGDNRIVISPNSLSELTSAHIETREEAIATADVCLVGLEIPSEAAVRALEIARQHGVRTVLNPAPSPPPELSDQLLALSDVVTPNQSEAQTMSKVSGEADEQARALVERGAHAAVVTVGADGVVFCDGRSLRRVSAPHVSNVVDTSGAGDAFNAAFVVAWASGRGLEEACRIGCEAGARIITGPGFVDALDTWQGLGEHITDVLDG